MFAKIKLGDFHNLSNDGEPLNEYLLKEDSLSRMSDVEILRLHDKLKKEVKVHSELTSAITVELVNRGWRQEELEKWTWKTPNN